MKHLRWLSDEPRTLALTAIIVTFIGFSLTSAAASDPTVQEGGRKGQSLPKADNAAKAAPEVELERAGPLLEDDGREFFLVPIREGSRLHKKEYTGRKLSGEELRSDPRWKFQHKKQHNVVTFVLCMIAGAGIASLAWYAKFRYDRGRVTRDIESRGGSVKSFRMPFRLIRTEYDVIYCDHVGKRRRGTCIVQGSTVYWNSDSAF